MKTIIIFYIIILSFHYFIIAQPNKQPQALIFETEDDYKKYESKVLEMIEWLLSTPIDSNIELRNTAKKFVRQWIKGTPTLIEIIDKNIIRPILKDKKNAYISDLLFAYLAGMARFQIKNPSIKDSKIVQHSGIMSVLELYKNNIRLINKSRSIKKYENLRKKGKLDDWIEKNIIDSGKQTFDDFYENMKNIID